MSRIIICHIGEGNESVYFYYLFFTFIICFLLYCIGTKVRQLLKKKNDNRRFIHDLHVAVKVKKKNEINEMKEEINAFC